MTETPDSDTTWYRRPPLSFAQWRTLLFALVAVVAAGVAIGFLLTETPVGGPIVAVDEDVAQQWVEIRSDHRDSLATAGSFLSDTPVKIAVSLAFAALFAARWKRWYEISLVGVSLLFEATAFIIITFFVGRARPDVPRLLDSPVNSSFPSGHVAAATVYGALLIVLWRHVSNRAVRALATIVAIAVPIIVAMARMYQGMHYLSDVIFGVVLGLVSLAVTVRVVGAGPSNDAPSADVETRHAVGTRPAPPLARVGAESDGG